jgi:hypothetical protein
LNKLKTFLFLVVAGLLVRMVPLIITYFKDSKDGTAVSRTIPIKDGKMSKEFVNSLKEYAQEANKDCPYITDEGVRMERVYFTEIGEWRNIIFEYTLLNTKKSDLDLEEFRENMTKNLLDKLRADYTLNRYKNIHVVFQFLYFDDQHEEVDDIRFILSDTIIPWTLHRVLKEE